MIRKIVAAAFASVLGGMVLGLIFVMQNSFEQLDNYLWGALVYYTPIILFLVVLSRIITYSVNRYELIGFFKSELGLYLSLLIVILITIVFEDKISNDYQFFKAFLIAYIIAMLAYLSFKKVLK